MSEVDVMTTGFTASDVARAAGGRLAWGGKAMEAFGVSTDTRTLAPGELFIPLVGPRYDGHGFLGKALARGAAGVLAASGRVPPEAGGAFAVEVADTLRALGDLARFHRGRHEEVAVVAVTGSNGKTTTKDMLAAVLAEGAPTLKSEGNLNNLVGLPQQVLRLEAEHRRAVFEMGMNRPGEIRRLTEIARPAVVVITNIAPAHLEGLGSIEAVRAAKGEALEAMGPGGAAVLCADDAQSAVLAGEFRRAGGRVLGFGFSAESEVRAEDVRLSAREGTRFRLRTPAGDAEVGIPALGRHNVRNALAAAAAGSLLGATLEEIARGLAKAVLPPMRLALREVPGRPGCFLLDDAYNANPASVLQALETAGALREGGRLFAVLGDMAELGSYAPDGHREVGRAVAALAAGREDFFAAVGPLMALAAEAAAEAGMPGERIRRFDGPAAAAGWVAERLRRGDWVLVKGSRSMRMERAVEALGD